MSILKAYKYKLYPTRAQVVLLQETLNRYRELYNAALQERRDCYSMVVKRHPNCYDEETRRRLTRERAITYSTQSAQLPDIKELRPEYTSVHSQVLQDVLRRVQKAFDGFFRRCAEGRAPGYPRFQGYGRYNSFTYPQLGFSLTEDHRVCLSKIGTIKLNMPKGQKRGRPKGAVSARRSNSRPVPSRGKAASGLWSSPPRSNRSCVIIHRKRSRAWIWVCWTLLPWLMGVRSTIPGTCGVPRANSKHCNRNWSGKNGDQSGGARRPCWSANIIGISATSAAISITRRPESW